MCKIRDDSRFCLSEATEDSCEGMRQAIKIATDIEFSCDEGNIFLASYEEALKIPVKFCPFCGTPMEIEVHP